MSRTSPPISTADIAAYYERNTRRFLFMGRGTPSLHRALWAPGVGSEREATAYVDRLLADELVANASSASPVIVDFGCGVGGTLFHLAERIPHGRLIGVTLSAKQAAIADGIARERDVASRCTFVQGDFHGIDLAVRADAIIAVESFVHSTSIDAFLANAARHLRAGGRLLVVDDFVSADVASLPERHARRVEELRSGWRIPSLCTVDHLLVAAATHGFAPVRSLDLTPLTRPGSRLRDRLTGAVAPVVARLGLGRMPFYGNMIGGNALQIGLRDGFVTYRMLVFEKASG